MPKIPQAPPHKVVHSSREHIPCAEEVMEAADRGWERGRSLMSLDQIGAETKVEFTF